MRSFILKLHGLTPVGSSIFWRWSASPQAAPFSRFIGSTRRVRRGIHGVTSVDCLVAGLVLFMQLMTLSAKADIGPLQIKLDKSEVMIGNIFHLTITLNRPQDSELEGPDIEKDLSKFEIRDFKISEKKNSRDSIETTLIYKLSSFETGHFTIGPLKIKWTSSKNKEATEVLSDSVSIYVKSLIDLSRKDLDIRGPKPPLAIKENTLGLFLILLGVILSLFAAWILAKKTKIMDIAIKENEKSLNPSEAALLRLEQLALSNELKSKKMKIVYSLLSEILRQYLGKILYFDPLDMTTSECIRELKRKKTDSTLLDIIKTILEECDLVKFAKYEADISEAVKLIESTKDIVIQTKGVTHAV